MIKALTMILGGGAMALAGHFIETRQIDTVGGVAEILMLLGGVVVIIGVFRL